MKIKIFQRFNQGTSSFGSVFGIIVFFVFLLIVPLTILVPLANGAAKEWPNRPITIIVPWSPGSGTDLTPRIMGPRLSKILGVPINVVNKPGGSGVIGTLEVMKAPPDGYTLLGDCGATASVQYAFLDNLPYKIDERTYIARTILAPLNLVVPASTPWKTVDDLANAIRANPSSITYGIIGGTGVTDVVIAQFLNALKAKGVDVPKTRAVSYKGAGETAVAIAGGHLSFSSTAPATTDQFVKAGKARVLAVTSPERWKGWSDVPTTVEAGWPSVDMVYWAALSGPPGMPANVVKILANAVKESFNDPDVVDKLGNIALTPFYMSDEGGKFKKFVLDEGESIKALRLNKFF